MLYNRFYTISTLLVVLLLSSNILAQNFRGRPEGDPKERLEKVMADLTERLSLMEAQAEKIRDIFVEHFRENRPQMNRGRNENRGREKPAMANHEELDKQIIALLNEDQVIKYKKWREEMQQQREKELPSGLRK